MPNPRPLSIVKLKDPTCADAVNYDLRAEDRFIYYGEIAQDATRCIVEGLLCGKRLPYFSPDIFEEVAANDF